MLALVRILPYPSRCDGCTKVRRAKGNSLYRGQFGTYTLCARHGALYTVSHL